ncbi:MAG: minichromosome maintenance protein MCM [Nanoarchaeota archaeon]
MVDVQRQIERFREFIETNYEKELNETTRKGLTSLVLDFKKLSEFDIELSEDLIEDPENTLKAAEVALQGFDLITKGIRVRINNLIDSQKIKIKDIRAVNLAKFVSVEGIVRQASDVRPQVVSAKFECPSCGSTMTMLQLEQTFKEPTRCSCGRRGRFRMLSKELVDSQRIVLEESPESLIGGEQPKRLSIFLREDLVEPKMERRTTPGSKISVTGIVKEISLPSKTGAPSTRFDLVCEANYIEPIEATYEDIEITKEDEKQIKELAQDPKIYENLINSMAPSIYGHKDIKAALVLQLMGGVRKVRPDGTSVKGDIHILLVGEPGTAKSSLLLFMAKAAPKSRYVAGRSVTGAGISAAVVKDEFLRGWALEAGALVLANKGILCIDELDKMSEEDTSALHESMAQQTLSIAKANIQATLKAETTILSAANPKFGRFNPYEPIAPQINLPASLINRFDLIFPVKDMPDKEKDTKIASHILEMQQNTDLAEPQISFDLLKKFIAYVRQKISPKLTQGAVEEIKEFYVSLRNDTPTIGGDPVLKPIPISARQLETLIRLAEASARIRLSNHVTRKDAKNAIEILKQCLIQVGFDYETGRFDIDRITTGITASTRNKILIIKEIIEEIEKKGRKSIPIEDIMSEAAEKGLTEAQAEDVLHKLKQEGTIYEPKTGFISKLS